MALDRFRDATGGTTGGAAGGTAGGTAPFRGRSVRSGDGRGAAAEGGTAGGTAPFRDRSVRSGAVAAAGAPFSLSSSVFDATVARRFGAGSAGDVDVESAGDVGPT